MLHINRSPHHWAHREVQHWKYNNCQILLVQGPMYLSNPNMEAVNNNTPICNEIVCQLIISPINKMITIPQLDYCWSLHKMPPYMLTGNRNKLLYIVRLAGCLKGEPFLFRPKHMSFIKVIHYVICVHFLQNPVCFKGFKLMLPGSHWRRLGVGMRSSSFHVAMIKVIIKKHSRLHFLETEQAERNASQYYLNHCHMERGGCKTHPQPLSAASCWHPMLIEQ